MGEGCCNEKYEMEKGCCQDEKSCCSEEKSGCCEASSGCCEEQSCCSDGYCDMSREMRLTADKAWGCLLKEKIKKAYESKMGKEMDELANLCADHSIKMHGLKMSGHAEVKAEIESFKKKLTESMHKK